VEKHVAVAYAYSTPNDLVSPMWRIENETTPPNTNNAFSVNCFNNSHLKTARISLPQVYSRNIQANSFVCLR